MVELSVIVPTYNESENVRELVDRIDRALSVDEEIQDGDLSGSGVQGRTDSSELRTVNKIDYEIIFVDDSNDETVDVIKSCMKEHPCIRMEHRETEKGVATAVILGFKLAEGEIIAVMDGDLQHPPETLKCMYDVIKKGYDICLPSRFLPGASDGEPGFYRRMVSAVARNAGKLMLPFIRRISDPTSGFFMFRRKVIEGVELIPMGSKIMAEILAVGRYDRVAQIPYSFSLRPAGRSKLDLKLMRDYLRHVLYMRRRCRNKGVIIPENDMD